MLKLRRNSALRYERIDPLQWPLFSNRTRARREYLATSSAEEAKSVALLAANCTISG